MATTPATARFDHLPLATLRRAPRNPKQHDLGALHEAYNRFGYVAPMIVNATTGQLVAGHGRLDALLQRKKENRPPPPFIEVGADGDWLIPVRLVPFTNDAEAEAYLLADNRITELGGQDNERLAELLKDLAAGPGLEGTGYDRNDLDQLLLDLGKENGGGADDVPEPPAVAITKPGDIWRLGDHRLICGDSRDPNLLHRALAGDTLDLIVTSPPYNANVQYGEENEGRKVWDVYRQLLEGVVRAWVPELHKGRALVWNIGVTETINVPRQWMMLEDAGLQLVRLMVWDKMGCTVPCWFHTEKDPKARNFKPDINAELLLVMSKGALEPGAMTSIDDLTRGSVVHLNPAAHLGDVPTGRFGPGSRPNEGLTTRKKAHPAPYPVRLAEAYIRNLTSPGELVGEPFSGSGTNIVACERHGRRCIAFELVPEFCDVAIERWQKLTGKTATREKA